MKRDNTHESTGEKKNMHPHNLHRQVYDFPSLIVDCPELTEHVTINSFGDRSIDFSDPIAVKILNKALLKHFYQVDNWDLPAGYLCPPVPGRVDYIHYLADLLGVTAKSDKIRVLDIGAGANCIYPLLGHQIYGWRFVGSEIDPVALRSARNIIEINDLKNAIALRRQDSPVKIFDGIINHGERFDATMCNPPFHSSPEQAEAGNKRKWTNLGARPAKGLLNFGGKNNELWCAGGEAGFTYRMISESVRFSGAVRWFTTLISKKETLKGCYQQLEKVNAAEVKTISMSQGQKVSRILAWHF